MDLNASNVISLLSATVVAVMGFILREKNKKLDDHDKWIDGLNDRVTIQETANKFRDERSERIEQKLDKIMEKLGAS